MSSVETYLCDYCKKQIYPQRRTWENPVWDVHVTAQGPGNNEEELCNSAQDFCSLDCVKKYVGELTFTSPPCNPYG